MNTIATNLPLDINAIDFSKQTAFSVNESHKSDIIAAANSIHLGDTLSVHNFGISAKNTNDYLDTLLADVRINEQKESGKQLAVVADLAQQISESIQPSPLQIALRRIPVVGAMISRLAVMQRKTLSRFDSVKNQMSLLTDGISSMSQGYLEENAKFESMYQDVRQEVQNQGVYIVAAELAITSLQSELKKRQDAFRADKANQMLGVEISDIEYQLNALKNRRASLISNQQKSFDDLSILRMMQQNNLTLVDKFRTIDEMTIPAAKRGHLIVDALEKQNNGAKLTKAIDDTTNDLAIRQARLVKDSSVLIAKQSHRTVYDVETLNTISKLMTETITEVKKIHRDSETGYLKLEKRAGELQEERRARLLEGMSNT